MIALDTLCASHVSSYGYRFDTTPNIDRWGERAVQFQRCYASDVPTPPSYTAMFSGRFGVHNGIFGFQDPGSYRAGPPMVQELLSKAGWETCAVSNLFYPCPWLLPGWQTIMPPGLRFQGGRAPAVTDRAVRWLEANRDAEDTFLFVHYWEPHQPYNKAPLEHREQFPAEQYAEVAPDLDVLNANPIMRSFYREYHRRGENNPDLSPAEVMARYDAQVHYVDQAVGRLLDYLDAEGLSDGALTIVTSDHGEAFGEYGSFDHFTCYENISHVPLIVRPPEPPSERTQVPGFVYGADLAPTIIDLAGLEAPAGLDGRSLRGCLTGEPAPHSFAVTDCNALVAQRMIVDGDLALAHTLNRGPFEHIQPYELFDVNGDPEQDLSAERPEKVRELRLKMQDWLAEVLDGGPDPLQAAAEQGGWTFGHPCLLHGVLENLDYARRNRTFWRTLCSKHGPSFDRLTGMVSGG